MSEYEREDPCLNTPVFHDRRRIITALRELGWTYKRIGPALNLSKAEMNRHLATIHLERPD